MYKVSGKTNVLPFVVGAGGVTAGDLVVIAAGAVVAAAAAPTAATIVGIATNTAAQNATCYVDLIGDSVIRAPYTGAVKLTIADADFGTAFDLSTATTVNLDDVVGGPCVCVGYDNDAGTIEFIVPEALKYC